MSEIKALAGVSAATRGVDVNPDDVVTDENLRASAAFASDFARRTDSVVAITGAIDIVADAERAFAVRNGVAMMGRITGSGCMLTCVVAAYLTANADAPLEAALSAVAGMGLAGQRALACMKPTEGNATFRTHLIDELYRMTADVLAHGARVEPIALPDAEGAA